MRLGVDARELSGRPTGVGRYLSGLLREWTSTDAVNRHEILLYSHRPIQAFTRGCGVRELPGAGGTLWEQRTLATALRRDAVDVLFSPAYSTPVFTAVPRVVALHDISFAARPEWFGWREGIRRRALARRAAAVAAAVITISEFSKSEIVARFGTPASRIHVIPPGIDAPPASAGTDGARVLYVGSIFNRRHVPDLVAAFSSLAARHPEASLHLVGDNRSHPYEDIGAIIAASPVSSQIHWHHYVADGELRELYRQGRAFVFLSEYEGLGLTPLEALAAGIPPLLLDTAVARESCGAAALYVRRGSVEETTIMLERLLYDEATRRTLLGAAPGVLARFDWPTAARRTLDVLEGAR